jgi:hypothetical protein
MFRRATLCRGVVAILICGALLAGCGDDGNRDIALADAYIVVMEWIFAQPEFAPDPTVADTRPVFVESLATSGIDLDVQVEIVNHFEPAVGIRFVDIRTEALDETAAGAPVRDEGLLFGLGPVPVAGPIDIRGEVYRAVDRVVGYRFRVGRRGQAIVLIGPPQRVEPEGLVGEL